MSVEKYKRQIQELNTYITTRIAPSKIHGVGVFAMRDLPKGTKLYADIMPRLYNLPHRYFSFLFPEVREMMLERFPQIVNGSNFVHPDTRIQAFMNHSDDPNYDAKEDILLRDVKKGEEITEDYRRIENWGKVFKWLKKKV